MCEEPKLVPGTKLGSSELGFTMSSAINRDQLYKDQHVQLEHLKTHGYIAYLTTPETVFKEKHGVWDPMPELTIL
jgi:hypothetical protein